jgi:hypothetical protein
MKSHTEYLVFETRKRKEMVHITEQIEPGHRITLLCWALAADAPSPAFTGISRVTLGQRE